MKSFKILLNKDAWLICLHQYCLTYFQLIIYFIYVQYTTNFLIPLFINLDLYLEFIFQKFVFNLITKHEINLLENLLKFFGFKL